MSLFRKFLKSNPKDDSAFNQFARPNNVQTMGASLQRKFARGVHYNMKIVIRGDRNVGKTCLFERLQGQMFKEEYLPTDEIQVASIHWNYKTTDDVVKVEVWDIVDKGRKKKKNEGLKLENDIPTNEEPILDADFLDVYKGTHGVLMMLDMTKSWTLDYVERELPCVPHNIPVLVLANHRDMGHHRTVSGDQVKTFIESLDRPPDAAQVRYAETSMRTAFGLKYIHRFFSLPFLQLQRETLLKQLETNRRDIVAVVDELETMEESEDCNYEVFRSQLMASRNKTPGSAATSPTTPTSPSEIPSPTSPLPGPNTEKAARLHAPPARPIPGMEAYLRSISQPNAQQPSDQSSNGSEDRLKAGAATNEQRKENIPSSKQPTSPSRRPGLYKDHNMSKSSPAVSSQSSYSNMGTHQNVDDFMPPEEANGLSSFLDESEMSPEKTIPSPTREESSSDDEAGNPMVADFQEDIDSDDEKPIPRAAVVASRHLEMSTDEGEDEDEDFEIATESVRHPSSSREASDLTVTSSTTPNNNVAHHREMSSSGYTSASSEKPVGRQNSQTNGADVPTNVPTGANIPSFSAQGDVDSSDEEEEKVSKKSKNSNSVVKRKTAQPSTMEEECEDEDKITTERPPPPVIVLENSDLDFLERRASKASSSLDENDQEKLTPANSDIVDDHSMSKKHSKKHRREKDGEGNADDQEKRKNKKQKKKTGGDDEDSRKSRKKTSHRSQNEAEESQTTSSKKGKKKSKRKGLTPTEDSFQLDGNSDLERFLNDTSTGGAYEAL